jgi:hypothetical protein
MLVDDETGKEVKVKTWKSKWSDTFAVGMEITCEIEEKPDRDGLGNEIWLKNPEAGKGGFAPRTFDSWFNAYQLAIAFMAISTPTKKIEFKDLDGIASKFKERLTNGPALAQAKESAIVDLKESGLALEESEGEEVPEIADEELEL